MSTNNTIGFLVVETDWDFGVIINGKRYADYEQTIPISDLQHLRDIEYLGPAGRPLSSDTKLGEIKRGLEEILKNPEEGFNNTGGNRGVRWLPCPEELPETNVDTETLHEDRELLDWLIRNCEISLGVKPFLPQDPLEFRVRAWEVKQARS